MSFTFASPIHTGRLTLIPATAQHVAAELESDAAFSALINAVVPASWPPGQYDRDAQQYFLQALTEAGDAGTGWFGWYALSRANETNDATVIGCGGYFGPPSDEGVVEIGYSVCAEAQGRGFGTELARALVEHVRKYRDSMRVIAHTHDDNQASILVLERSGFVRAEVSDQPDAILFEWKASSATPA